MTKKLFLIIVPILIGQTLFSQKQILNSDGKSISKPSIDSVTQKLMDAAGVTGLSLGIVNDNKTAYVKSYGYKNKATSQLSDTATIYYAASFSKSVFAYLVMQLVDKGIINLDNPPCETQLSFFGYNNTGSGYISK